MIEPREIHNRRAWDAALLSLPSPHLLQSWLWGEAKAEHGWRPRRMMWADQQGNPLACAQILERSQRLGFLAPSVLYCPKGPVLDWSDRSLRGEVLDWIQRLAISDRVLQIKIDPDIELGRGIPGEDQARDSDAGKVIAGEWRGRGWLPSREQIQFRNTLVLSVDRPEEEILAAMKQKTRYNVRLSRRKGIRVRRGGLEDLDLLYQMYAHTSLRDGFVIRHPDYYRGIWTRFMEAGLCQPLIAEFEGEAVSAIIVFSFGSTAWYLYGMSLDEHREKMPTYQLQWEAIRWAKSMGCSRYDMWGAPETFTADDPLAGVFRFKSGFGPEFVRTIGAWDYAASRLRYWLYHLLMPLLLSLRRSLGQRQTRRQMEGPLRENE